MSVKASLIARLLKFYHMKNIHIPLNHLRLTDEQLSIINLCTRIPGEPGDNEVLPGIFVINSSAGTGKTTTAHHLSKSLMNQGVICVAYTKEASSHFKRQLWNIVDDIDRVNDRIKPSHTKGDRVSEEAQHKKPIQIYIATIDSLANNFATIPANIAPDS